MTKLTDRLKQIKSITDESLKDALPHLKGRHQEVVDAISYSFIGTGKALRPFLVHTVSKMFSLSEQTIKQIALAVEMVHTYSLIHDDLPAMDNDNLRRGKPTCHVKFSEATAILAGDALLTQAFDVLANKKTHPDASIRCKLITFLAKSAGLNGMVGGQMMDLSAEKTPLLENEIYQMQKMKTGALLEFACLAPAIAANADDKIILHLKKYINAIGLMFQITDDLLDENGNEKEVGKTLKKDSKANKSTLLKLYGEEKVKMLLNELYHEAISSIRQIQDETQSILSELAQFILTRTH